MSKLTPAVDFVGIMMANVDNEKISDADFRRIFKTTLPIVEKPDWNKIANPEVKKRVEKYYK